MKIRLNDHTTWDLSIFFKNVAIAALGIGCAACVPVLVILWLAFPELG